jgi:hypothetical protein
MLGRAGTIRSILLESPYVPSFKADKESSLDVKINRWCEENEHVDIIDIKFSTHSEGKFYEDSGDMDGYYIALIIYRI